MTSTTTSVTVKVGHCFCYQYSISTMTALGAPLQALTMTHLACAVLADTVAHVSRQFGRVLAMPNIQPPVLTLEHAIAYKRRIEAHVPPVPATAAPLEVLSLHLPRPSPL